MQPGHVSLPNGLGLSYPDDDGARRRPGVAPNELTVDRGPRLARRHAVAQARAGAHRGAGGLTSLDAAHPLRRLACPIARATDLIGDWWTPLVLRDAFFGLRRFEDIQEELGIPRRRASRSGSTGSSTKGWSAKGAYEEHPPRYEYRLTDKGREFWDVLAAMWRWATD